jgi:hypothetical protein
MDLDFTSMAAAIDFTHGAAMLKSTIVVKS